MKWAQPKRLYLWSGFFLRIPVANRVISRVWAHMACPSLCLMPEPSCLDGPPWTLIHVLPSRHTVSAPVCFARAWPCCFLANPSLTMHIPGGRTLHPHNNSCHVLSTYYVPDDVLSAFYVIIHLILRIIFFEISSNIISIVQIRKRRSKRLKSSRLVIQEVTKPGNGKGGFESNSRDNFFFLFH